MCPRLVKHGQSYQECQKFVKRGYLMFLDIIDPYWLIFKSYRNKLKKVTKVAHDNFVTSQSHLENIARSLSTPLGWLWNEIITFHMIKEQIKHHLIQRRRVCVEFL